VPANATFAPTLKAAAEAALGGRAIAPDFDAAARAVAPTRSGGRVAGLFSGGTLCAEAQTIFRAAGEAVVSNAPVPGAGRDGSGGDNAAHRMIDLGADEYTRGRPHPMIDPALRDLMLGEALEDPEVAVVLLDLVIGHGAHPDPASEVAGVLARAVRRPPVAASVCGTEGDPQGFSEQVETLRRAGVNVAPTNADAAALAGAIARRLNGGCG